MKPNPTTLADTYKVAGPRPCSDFIELGMWQSKLNKTGKHHLLKIHCTCRQ